jgi:hypothetical protein
MFGIGLNETRHTPPSWCSGSELASSFPPWAPKRGGVKWTIGVLFNHKLLE